MTKASDPNQRRARRPPAGEGREHSSVKRPGDDSAPEIIYGKHSVRAVFLARPEAIRRVVMRERAVRYLQEFVDLAKKSGIQPELMRSGEFLRQGKLDADDKHQGIFVVADPVRVYDEHDFDVIRDATMVLVLDQISNPQNLGTIIRTAAFFGVDAVVYPKDRAVSITSTVSRVSVGGTEFVRLFRITNLARSLERLKERSFWVYGVDERGPHTLAETQFDDKTAIVIGAENEGLRQRTRSLCDEVVRIPGGRQGVESLNAAVAAGIAMAEVVR